jgi:hypothetical protein
MIIVYVQCFYSSRFHVVTKKFACFLLSCHVMTILMFVFYSQIFVIFCGINYLIKLAKFVKAIFCLCIIWFIMVFFFYKFNLIYFLIYKLEIYVIKRIFCVNCVLGFTLAPNTWCPCKAWVKNQLGNYFSCSYFIHKGM